MSAEQDEAWRQHVAFNGWLGYEPFEGVPLEDPEDDWRQGPPCDEPAVPRPRPPVGSLPWLVTASGGLSSLAIDAARGPDVIFSDLDFLEALAPRHWAALETAIASSAAHLTTLRLRVPASLDKPRAERLLGGLQRLERLDLWVLNAPVKKLLALAARLPRLRQLSLQFVSWGGCNPRPLGACPLPPALQRLHLVGVCTELPAATSALTALTALEVDRLWPNDAARLPLCLRELSVMWLRDSLTQQDCAALAALTNLQSLTWPDKAAAADGGQPWFARLPRLHSLAVVGGRLTPDLPCLGGLTELRAQWDDLQAPAADVLQACTSLARLRLPLREDGPREDGSYAF